MYLYSMILSLGKSIFKTQVGKILGSVVIVKHLQGSQWPSIGRFPTRPMDSPNSVYEQMQLNVISVLLRYYWDEEGLAWYLDSSYDSEIPGASDDERLEENL